MTADDPRDAIIDRLSAPVPQRQAAEIFDARGRIIAGWPASAQPDSVAFVKERHGQTRSLYAVTYLDSDSAEHLDIVCARRHTDGSWMIGRARGGTNSDVPSDQPRVNLGGLWGPELFWAGGRLTGHGAQHAQRVRLVFGDGNTLDDSIEDDLVLFLAEHAVEIPATAQIFGAGDKIIATHKTFA